MILDPAHGLDDLDLVSAAAAAPPAGGRRSRGRELNLRDALNKLERELLLEAHRRADGVRKEAAHLLGHRPPQPELLHAQARPRRRRRRGVGCPGGGGRWASRRSASCRSSSRRLALQAVLALILAGILGAFHRLYRHAYLRHWSLSWLALVVYIGASAVGRPDCRRRPHPWRLAAVLVSLVAGYLQVAWLLLGAWGLARGREVPARTVRLGLGAAAAAGLASVLPALAGVPRAPSMGLRCLVAAVAYLAAAAAILARRRPLARVGGTFAALALALYAADQLAYFALSFGAPGQPGVPPPAADDVRPARDRGPRARPRGVAARGRAREAGPGGRARAAPRARAGLRLPHLRGHPDGVGPPGAVPLDPREPRGRASREELLHRTPRPGHGPRELPVLLRRARHDPRPEVAGAGPDGVRPAHRAAAAGDPRGLPRPRRARRGRAHRHRLRGLAGSAARGARRGDRGGGGPDLRPRRAPRARRTATCSSSSRGRSPPRSRPSARRTRCGRASRGSASRSSRCRPCCGRRTSSCASPRPWGRASPRSASPRTRSSGCPLEEYLGAGSLALDRERLALRGESAGYDHERDGRAFTVHVEPLRDTGGAVRGTVGIALDVTDARRADQALRESEARLRQVIDLVPHFIFAKDEDGRFLLANRAVAEAYGTTVDGLIGRTDADFARSEEEVQKFRGDDLEVLRSGLPKVAAEERITDARGRRTVPADHEDPVLVLGHRPSRGARRVDRHLGEEGGGGDPAPRGQGGEPQRARGRRGARLQQPPRRHPRPRLAGPEAAPGSEPGAAAHREGGEGGGEGRRPHPADAGLLRAGPLRGAAHRRERPRPREPAAARGGGAEERAARGPALPGPAADRRRRRPDPAGADEPRHQRRGGDRGGAGKRHGVDGACVR